MKKCILYTSLSAFVLTLLGVLLGFVGNGALFSGAIAELTALFPLLWYVIIPPGVFLLLIVIVLIIKIKRRVRMLWVPLFSLISILAYLLLIPKAFTELITTNTPPTSLYFTTGAGLVFIGFVALLVLLICDLSDHKKKEDEEALEIEEEQYEVIEEEPKVKPVTAKVEYLDEEVEDEEGFELESPDEAMQRKADAKKAKLKAKDEKDKEYDRIYHIMKRAKDDRWIVKIAQSRKAIKIFDTQKEAITYAEGLAGNNNGVVRIFASKGANKGRIIT